LNGKHLGTRYIELFDITVDQFYDFLERNRHNLINNIQIEFDKKSTY